MRLACVSSLFIVLIVPNVVFGQSSDAAPPMLGMWSSASVDGVAQVRRKECTSVGVTERRLQLNAVPGTSKVEGEWIRWGANIWMATDGLKCRWFAEDSQFQPMFQASWVFLIDGVYDKTRGVLKIDGKFAKCDGNACNRWMTPTITAPFKTELRVANGRLVDTNQTDDATDDIRFVRVSDEADRVDDARTASSAWMKLVDRGDFVGFYDQATSSSFRVNTSRMQFIAMLAGLRDRSGAVSSRQNLKTLYAQHVPFVSKSAGEYVLFWSGVESTKGLRGWEFLVLVNEDSDWKVAWMNYGS